MKQAQKFNTPYSFFKYLQSRAFQAGKTVLVFLLIFQIFTQPLAIVAMHATILQQRENIARQSKDADFQKPQKQTASIIFRSNAPEKEFESILPGIEHLVRDSYSSTFGRDLPVPQIFGENGKLSAILPGGLLANNSNRNPAERALSESKKARLESTASSSSSSSDKTHILRDAAISVNAPVLKSGSIDGTLRVLSSSSFALNEGFRLSENLYAYGLPNVSTQSGAPIKNVINEKGDLTENDYRISLNGGEMGGKIFVRSNPPAGLNDYPKSIPGANGTEDVIINSPDDIGRIKDWKNIKKLTINASGLTINVPPGNYESITLNAPNRLNFSEGVYNFFETINLGAGSFVQIQGKTSLNIRKNLNLENSQIILAENISPEEVNINVLGSAVTLSGESKVSGSLRALNANVFLNDSSDVFGQVIAGSLIMGGGTITGSFANAALPTNSNNAVIVKKGFNLDGRIEGSVHQQLAQNTILNGSGVITGDLLVPGVPALTLNGTPTFGGVVTGSGNATPTNHRITLNQGSQLRKLKNRVDPVTIPSVSNPPSPQGTVNVNVNNPGEHPANFSNIRNLNVNSNAGTVAVPPGTYGSFSVNSNSGLKFGVAGATDPVTYNFEQLNINSGSRIEIISPVILHLKNQLNLNAPMGVSGNPELLTVRIASGGINLNSNSLLYGFVNTPTGTVSINGGSQLVGNIICNQLTVNNGGVLKVELANPLLAPSVSITSPANNSTTAENAVTVSGTVQSSAGIANIFVNDEPATYNSASGTWSKTDVALNVGSNTIIVRALDNNGSETTKQITVTRQQTAPDVVPPIVSVSSPADGTITQSETITVSGNAVDPGANASGLASVTVNGQAVSFDSSGNWTISGISLNTGANTIVAQATDSAGNSSNTSVTVTRQGSDTQSPTVAITSPANNSETTQANITVSGTASDAGTNASGVASVTVGGTAAVISGGNWSLPNVPLTVGANVILVRAIDNAGNEATTQITVTRTDSDTQAPEIAITSPANNSQVSEATISVSGNVSDTGANATGIASVTVNGQTAAIGSGGTWTVSGIGLTAGANTITARATDNAGNTSSASISVTRSEADTQPPSIFINSPQDNSETLEETVTVEGTVVDDGSNASGVASVKVNGTPSTITGGTWSLPNVPLNSGLNTITVVATDNAGNSANASLRITRNPRDTQAPTIAITSPPNNFETFDSEVVVSGTVIDSGAGATGVRSVKVNGVLATYNTGANTWTATVAVVGGVNTITAVALDNAPTPNQSQTSIQVSKLTVQPPNLAVTSPQNGAFLSANSVTVAGHVSSNKPDMTFAVTINGAGVNLAGREFTKTVNLTDGTNVITVVATDALGQQSQQSITLTNDRTPPTVYLTNVPQVVNPGESYTIGAFATDAYGVADVEFTVDGASVSRSSVAPYQFQLNIPLDQSPNQNLNISAIARDNAGLSATATARVVTSGPSGLTGYIFDDASGYVLPEAGAKLNNQNPILTDENGLYSFISSNASGIVLLSKSGYTTIERDYTATAGSGVEIFDARLTPLDSKVNTMDSSGSAAAASDSGDKIHIQFAPNSFPGGTDVRITPVSPQGLANLLPFGWSPIPDAVVDIRTASETEFSNRNFATPASLTIPQISGLTSDIPVVLARYDAATHNWVVVQRDLFAGANGSLQANISSSGQYAFLVADTGATAPPSAVAGQSLPTATAANSEQLDNATATAFASPATALYSNTAKSRITFVADAPAKLPSGISIEASFSDSYLTLIERNLILVDRPSQDFVLYAYPSVGINEPNKLGAYFIAKPIRTDFGLTDLFNAKVHVDIRSGRVAQTGILIGQTGGIVRGAEGSELEIPGGTVAGSQIVFFNKIPNDQTGILLPEGYETVGAFDVNLAGSTLAQSAKISMPSIAGDNSKIVVAKVISIAGQQGLKFVGRVVENNSRLESTISQPIVPTGVNLAGIKDGGKYLFVRMPSAFGYIKGNVSSTVPNTQSIRVTNSNTPFVDVAANNSSYTSLGLANGANNQVEAVSLNNDATGFAATSLSVQDYVANLPISLASSVLSVQAVTPTNNATGVIVTTPVTVTFNKPILSSTVTGSNIKLVAASGNPVITTITMLPGGRSVVLTPSSNLQSETEYKVKVATGVKDIYGNPLTNAFESSFRTTNLVTAGNQLQPTQIRVSYPNEQGLSTISIPAGAVQSGSLIIAVNNSNGNTVSTVAGSSAIELSIQARVGDEIELIIRQPDGTEYRVKQAAYRRADGFVSVGSNGGTITSEDGTLVLQVPAGAISGQADVKMTFAPESSITTPREGEMSPSEMSYIGGVKIEVQGNFTNTRELHLELPAPANVQEGQRALVMKPSKINYDGNEQDVWETITSAKIENGKIKSTSPPFYGVTLVGSLLSISLLSFYIFIPQRQRVVTGLVRKQLPNGTYELIREGQCYISPLPPPPPPGPTPTPTPTPTPSPLPSPTPRQLSEINGPIDNEGRFAISHNGINLGGEVSVLCITRGGEQYGIGYPYTATQYEPGLFGFETRYANIIFPPDSPVNQPPSVRINGLTLGSDGTPMPETSDPLKQYGKVQVGSSVVISVGIVPSGAKITSQQLLINGTSQSLNLQCSISQQQLGCSTQVPTPTAGRYGVVVKARTVLSDPNTESTATFNFIVLNNPNVKPPISGVNPAVVSVNPIEGANQVDVGTSVHIEFSEPVKNLQSATIYLVEDEAGERRISGRIFSGGIPITSTDNRSVIDFIPDNRLKSNKNYRVIVTRDVIDTNESDPNELRYLDQDSSEPGLQEFSSHFKTFQGSVITPTPISAEGYKIVILDDLVITTKPDFAGPNSNGTMRIFDSTEFLNSSEPQNLQPIVSMFTPQIPLGLAAKKETLTLRGETRELNLIAITTIAIDTERPRNVWFFNIDENTDVDLIGVVSLIGDGNSGQVPNSIAIHNKRAYIGSSTNGGVFVVDIQQAIDAFGAQDDTPNDGNPYNNIPVQGAVSLPGQPYSGGFGQSTIMQKAPYAGGNDYFGVGNLSTITQGLTPFAYIASSKQKLVSFNFSQVFDGNLGFLPGGQNGKDQRVAVDQDTLPVSSLYDVKAVSALQIQGGVKDIAVGVAANLWVFDVSDPTDAKQYPLRELAIDPQPPAKSFAELGVPIEVGSIGRQIELEGTLVYVLFDNGVGVFDISNPSDPYLTTLIQGLPGLRYFAVKDGFIYTLGSNGLNVSIGRGVSQVITYGYDPTAPDEVCGNPVVISKENGTMVQPAGIFFQLLGQNTPQEAKVIIRKVDVTGGNRTETELATIPVNPNNLRTVSNPQTGFTVVTGNTFWQNNSIVIERDAIYTAEVVIDNNYRSNQVEIPFSNLLPEDLFQKEIKVAKTSLIQGFGNDDNVGGLTYLAAGNAVGVEFKINGVNEQLYDSSPSSRQPKPNSRPFGANVDYVVPRNLAFGLYPFTYTAKLKANPAYSEEISGTVRIGLEDDELRKPGSTVVSGVEINSGSLALSENDISIKGRGLSLDLTRSYNSLSADNFGTLGYGWTHSYQISLIHFPGGYQMVGGEGSSQKFLESKLENGEIKAEKPYLGRLVKNADGSFDYFTKSQTKYHFRQPVEAGSPNLYLGNLLYIEEPNKNRITLSYDSFGRLSTVADSSNRQLNFEYEAADNVFTGINVGDVIQGTQGCPRISQFRQITRRLEQSVTGKAWRIKQVTGMNIGGLTIDYGYDEKGNLISVRQDGVASSISEASVSRESKYTYNPSTNAEEKYKHILKTAKSPNNSDTNAATEYRYYLTATAPPRVQQIVMPEGVSNSFNYSYNQTTNVVTGATFTDGNNNLTSYELEDFRVKTITAPLGAVTRLEWTDFGQIKKTIDPEGKVAEIIFDSNNNPSTQTLTGAGGETIQTVTTFDTKFSKMSSFRDGNGNQTSYAINQTTGNVDEITLPTNRKVNFSYFPNGDLKDVTDQYGTKTTFANYDSYGNPQTITKQIGGGQTQVITQTFDARSRQRGKSDSLGTNAAIEYDAFDRPTKQVTSDPAGYRNALTVETSYLPEGQPDLIIQKDGTTQLNRTQNTFDKLQRLTKTVETVSGYAQPFTRNFTYDNNSNLRTEENRRGVTTEKIYNELNHLTRIVQGTKTVWEATEIDKVGNPKTVKDLFGNQTTYVYDGLQRLKEKQLPENATEKLVYDANNNITDSYDRNGNQTHYDYDGLNRIDTATDALGRKTKWTYSDAQHTVTKEAVNRGLTETTVMDGLERPVSQTIQFGNTNYQTTYAYDGRTVSVTDPRGTVVTQKLSGFGETGETEVGGANPAYKTTMFYTALGGVRQMTDANNRVTNCVNDGFNRKRSININGEFTESWNYDGEGLLADHTDRRGVKAEMNYDDLGRKISTRVKGTASAPIDIEAEKITYTDEQSLELIESAVNQSGSRNPVTLEYDGLRRVKLITNAENNSKSFVYDGENLREETDFYNQSQSRKTKYVYDKLNRLREAFDRANGYTKIDYSANDLIKTTTDRRGNITTENYDALGRLTSADSYGKLASFSYDGNSNRLTQQDGLNNETQFEYDKLNRVTRITHPNGLQIEQMSYDAVGNIKTHSDGRGGIVETLQYDALNQAKQIKDGAGNITKFDYDGGGLLLSKTEPKGVDYKTNYKYNAFGSLTEVAEPEQSPWLLNYDDAQNLTAMTDPLNRTVGYEYDALNRLKKTLQPLGRNTNYKYDNNSNLTEITDPKGQTSTMTYDVLDRLDTASYKDELNSEKLRHKYNYYQEDLLQSVVETKSGYGERTSTRVYDNRNRLTETKDAYNKTVGFGYDNANNLKTLTSAGQVTAYNYDGKNQLDTVSQNNTTVADYDWYADGLLKQVKYSDTQKRDFNYDNVDRVTNITNTIGGNSESFDYGYDANSNRNSEIRKANGQAFRTIAYDYDKLDRLTKADYTATVATPNPPTGQTAQFIENSNLNTYGYDAVGNRINETKQNKSKTITLTTDANGQTTRQEQVSTAPLETTTATYDALNQLTQLNEPNEVSTFDYDLNGNLSQIKKNTTITNKYEYDVRNQLSSAKDGLNNELAKFDYDFERKRLSKTSANFRTDYVYAGNSIVSEFQNNVASASYTIGAGEVVKSDFAVEGARYYFSDALGSTTSLADTNSSLIARNEYDAFGVQSSSGNTGNSIGYTGQRLDNETGLMALGNGERYYSPSYARFIQQDSWLGNNAMPQSMNRFSYGYNNPFKYTDPSGNEGVVADKLKNDNLNYNPNTGSESFDWWLRFGRSFVTGYTYDSLNVMSGGALGMTDVMAQDAVNGKISNPMDAWNRSGYGASPVQIAKNFAYYTAGVGKGIYNVAVGLPQLAYGLVTDPSKTVNGVYHGLAESTGSLVDTIADPRAALDKLAQNSQEDIAFGVGETVGEFVAGEGVGAAATKILGYAGKIIGRTRIGSATSKVFTEASSKVSAVRQGIRSFESKAGKYLNPRNYEFNFNNRILGSNGGGFEINFKPTLARENNALAIYDKKFALSQMEPVEINFPARGLNNSQRQAFSSELAIQEAELNRLSLYDTVNLESNLAKFHSTIPEERSFYRGANNNARRMARERLRGTGVGDAAHNLDAVAGGYMHNITSLRNPIQQRVGSLWKNRWQQIELGRKHRLIPQFED